jgi:hypothetical protein
MPIFPGICMPIIVPFRKERKKERKKEKPKLAMTVFNVLAEDYLRFYRQYQR